MPINPEQLKHQPSIGRSSGASAPIDNLSLRKELAEQREILLRIYENTRKTRRYILIGKIISVIYLILVIAPLILAAIYLPPLLKNAIEPYKELLGADNKASQNIDLKNIDPSQASRLLKFLK
jgi:hypothetical protein